MQIDRSRCEDILLVEDDDDIRTALGEILEDEGYRVTTVPHGLAALEALRGGGTPALILLDLYMPVMDGLEFLNQRRQLGARSASVPVVLFSASGSLPDVSVSDVLRKPVEVDQLLEVLARFNVPRAS